MARPRVETLRRRVRLLTGFVILGLALSGATALPLSWELDVLASAMKGGDQAISPGPSQFHEWIFTVRDALHETGERHPFLFYGTHWLAFGHFVIAITF